MELGSFKYQLGDIVVLKKGHPCGENRWEIIRTGMDFRLKCRKCGRTVMVPRPEFERAVREVHRGGELVAGTKLPIKPPPTPQPATPPPEEPQGSCPCDGQALVL